METFADLISSPVPVLVDVYAEWCAPCKSMAPVLKQLKEMQGDNIRIVKNRHRQEPANRAPLCRAVRPYPPDFQKRKTAVEAERRHGSSRTKQSHRAIQIKGICPRCVKN